MEIITTFSFRGENRPVYLLRSERSTLGLTIDRDNRIVVKAPYGVSLGECLRLVSDHTEWLRKHLEKQLERSGGITSDTVSERFCDGADFPYRNGVLKLRVIEDPAWDSESLRCRLEFYNAPETETENGFPVFGELTVKGNRMTPEQVREGAEKLVRKSAGDFLRMRLRELSREMGIDYGKVAVKDGSSRWGSCSAAGNVNLQWRLVMMPDSISDYVMVHELCHRLEMNHSDRFWREVEHFLPDYKARRKWLKDYGNRILQW